MKSRASIKGHPLHPILIAFPIAFFFGTLVCDIVSKIQNDLGFWIMAMYLEIAGVITGLLAAVPGFIDYLFVVPPNSSGKKRATKHALINVTNVVLFAIVWFYRQGAHVNEYIVIGLEVIGVVLIIIAGWLGGTLVYRNQIGVNPRYANAGKWNEAYFDQKSGSIEVAGGDELKVNQMKLLHINNKRIVLGRTEKGYTAFDDHCTHRGGSLAGGAMICSTVQCPWHGSQFDVETGAVKSGPAKANIHTYPVTEKDGKVYLQL